MPSIHLIYDPVNGVPFSDNECSNIARLLIERALKSEEVQELMFGNELFLSSFRARILTSHPELATCITIDVYDEQGKKVVNGARFNKYVVLPNDTANYKHYSGDAATITLRTQLNMRKEANRDESSRILREARDAGNQN